MWWTLLHIRPSTRPPRDTQVQAVKGRVPERTALPNATLPPPQAIDCYGRLGVTGHSWPA
jgi:hypothetical protein